MVFCNTAETPRGKIIPLPRGVFIKEQGLKMAITELKKKLDDMVSEFGEFFYLQDGTAIKVVRAASFQHRFFTEHQFADREWIQYGGTLYFIKKITLHLQMGVYELEIER